jgi:hypothetical protein
MKRYEFEGGGTLIEVSEGTLCLYRDVARELAERDDQVLYWRSSHKQLARLIAAALPTDTQDRIMNTPNECAASGASCSYAPDGPRGEVQCRYCGKAKS